MYETNWGEDSVEMTDLQFTVIESQKLIAERDALREENRVLRENGSCRGESGMSDNIFMRYEEYRDKCDASTKELDILRGTKN